MIQMNTAVSSRLRVPLADALAIGIVLTYVLARHPMPAFPRFLVEVGPLFAVVYWLREDARARRVPLVFDWGFFALMAWPIAIPWYLRRTRGPHAWPLTLLLLAAIAGPWFLATVAVLTQRR